MASRLTVSYSAQSCRDMNLYVTAMKALARWMKWAMRLVRGVITIPLDGLVEREFSTRLTFLECGRTQGRVSREGLEWRSRGCGKWRVGCAILALHGVMRGRSREALRDGDFVAFGLQRLKAVLYGITSRRFRIGSSLDIISFLLVLSSKKRKHVNLSVTERLRVIRCGREIRARVAGVSKKDTVPVFASDERSAYMTGMNGSTMSDAAVMK